MEIIDSTDNPITQPVQINTDLRFSEAFPDEKLERWQISDREWAIFALIQSQVKENGLVWVSHITNRVSTPFPLVHTCLKRLWQAGVIRRFYKLKHGISKAQPWKNQVWYVINNPDTYVLPEINKPAPRPRNNWPKQIPAEVIAMIRRYPPEVSTEAIAMKHNISVSHTDRIRNYESRKEVIP